MKETTYSVYEVDCFGKGRSYSKKYDFLSEALDFYDRSLNKWQGVRLRKMTYKWKVGIVLDKIEILYVSQPSDIVFFHNKGQNPKLRN